MKKVGVSIITVCLNAEKFIHETLESVLCLEGTNFEYIVKDGESKDSTNQVIESYSKKFEKKGIRFVHVIRHDRGIYDAMNQAMEYCRGEWVNYMNAGDTFYNPYVVTDIFERAIPDDVGVLYGHTLFRISKKLSFISNHTLATIDKEMPFCHQSTFVRSKLLKRYKFDCKYKILADYNLYLKLYKEDIKFKAVNTVISCFICDGISFKRSDDVNKERAIIADQCKLSAISHHNYFITKCKSIINSKYILIGNLFFCYKQMKRISNNMRQD